MDQDQTLFLDLLITHKRRGGVVSKTLRLDKGQIEIVDDAMAAVLRRKTPAERIAIGFGLWTAARTMLIAHLRREHPVWSDEQLYGEVARRMSHGAV